jgi:hypothetical protein
LVPKNRCPRSVPHENLCEPFSGFRAARTHVSLAQKKCANRPFTEYTFDVGFFCSTSAIALQPQALHAFFEQILGLDLRLSFFAGSIDEFPTVQGYFLYCE